MTVLLCPSKTHSVVIYFVREFSAYSKLNSITLSITRDIVKLKTPHKPVQLFCPKFQRHCPMDLEVNDTKQYYYDIILTAQTAI